jgi:hypothetical protein
MARAFEGKGPGIIYLIERSDGLHKIGHTSDLKARFRNIKYENRGYVLKIACTVFVESRIEAERFLHAHFGDKRVWHEWFNLTPDDVTLFKMLEGI